MSAPKPELTTQERAEKMVAEQSGFRVALANVYWDDGGWYGRSDMVINALWREAVRLQAELLGKESGEIEEGQ